MLDVNSSLVVCPFVVSASVVSFFIISPFGVSPFVFISKLAMARIRGVGFKASVFKREVASGMVL